MEIKRSICWADNLTTSMSRLSTNSGNLKLLVPQGLYRPVMRQFTFISRNSRFSLHFYCDFTVNCDIKCFVFRMDMHCVYSEEGNESLNII